DLAMPRSTPPNAGGDRCWRASTGCRGAPRRAGAEKKGRPETGPWQRVRDSIRAWRLHCGAASGAAGAGSGATGAGELEGVGKGKNGELRSEEHTSEL